MSVQCPSCKLSTKLPKGYIEGGEELKCPACRTLFEFKSSTQSEVVDKSNSVDSELVSTKNQKPIHWAAASNRVDMTKKLLKEGSDPEDEDGNGFKPVHIAASEGCAEVIQVLAEEGVELGAGDSKRKSTPLHWAVLRQSSRQLVELLISLGVDPDITDKYCATPLHRAAALDNPQVAR